MPGRSSSRASAIPSIRTPREAQSRGVFTVFQEVLVAESCSVLDNVWLGADGIWTTSVSPREKAARAKQMLGKLLGRDVDLGMAVEELSLSDRQACGIVRALVRNPRILILDEATSALDVATRDRLFELVAELSRAGVGVIFITHRMDEIEQIGDRITVMRSGKTVAELDRGHWTPQQLVRLMTGSDALGKEGHDRLSPIADRRGATVLSVRGLRLRPDGAPIDLEFKAGELIGLAGLEGHGGNTFLEALRGGIQTEGQVVRHLADGARRSSAPPPMLPIARSPTCRASAVSTPCSAGCRSARTSRSRRSTATPAPACCVRAPRASACGATSSASGSCSARPSTRSRRSRAATSRR